MTTAGSSGYRAAREGAAFVNRSDRVRIEFTGPQAADTLNGLLTNDVARLTPNTGHYAAALTAKGKVIADVRVFAREGGFLVDAPGAAGPALLAMLRKYVNPRLAKYRDASAESASLAVVGPAAAPAVAAACGASEAALRGLADYAHLALTDDATIGFVARVPDFGGTGFELFVPAERTPALAASLAAAGAVPLDAADADILRVEAGRPAFGADLDENVLAQEAGLDRLGAISFDKGCYTGQETVARVHFRGHVNRTLRGLRLGQVAEAGSEVFARGAEGDGAPSTAPAERAVGVVRSAVASPAFGPIALAYLRREVADGDDVLVRTARGDVGATVVALPFA